MGAGRRHFYGDMELCFILQPKLLKAIVRNKNCLDSLASKASCNTSASQKTIVVSQKKLCDSYGRTALPVLVRISLTT